MIRIWGLAMLAIGAWLAAIYGQYRPTPLPADAPPAQFSAARADAMLGRLLGDQRPRPAGSPEAAAFRTRLLAELARLGVPARAVTQMSCFQEARWAGLACGTVTNIIADVTPGKAENIVLMAHTDSVAAGPGAADDGSGVAILLETIRALRARSGATRMHPIVALFTDGEEGGLLGAAAYMRDPRAKIRTGAVINVEARGNQGPSYLFQTSPGNGRLIDIYAQSVPHPAASSLYGEIYKYLPNDTDLTPMLEAGRTGLNFAFIGNAAQYHTPLDRRENIAPASLQQQGENLLEMADALAETDLSALHDEDAAYLDVLGRFLPRLPQSWLLPLAVGVLLAILLAGRLTRRRGPDPRLAVAMPGLLLAGAVGAGFGLTWIAVRVSGHADPSFAHPLYLRLALGFGVWAVALLVSRWAGAVASWVWLATPALACAVFAPGVTPYFLFPSLVAAPLLLLTAWGGRGPALVIAALPALIVWIGLAAGTEPVMGLRLHMLFTVTVAFGLIALLPLLAGAPRLAWIASTLVSLAAAMGLAFLAGKQPATSPAAPQRLNLRYVEQDGKAFWQADAAERLPPSLRAVASFGGQPQRLLDWGYVAPAGAAHFPPPLATATRKGDDVTLDLAAPGQEGTGRGVMVTVPKEAKLKSLTIGGLAMPAPESGTILCVTPDCGAARMVLHLGSPGPAELLLVTRRSGLPPDGAKLLAARPPDAVPSGRGDETLLAAKIAVPGR